MTLLHPPHGEVSGEDWRFVDDSAYGGGSHIELELETKVRPGKVKKKLALRRGHSAIYISHEIEGFAGPITLGHHVIMPGDRTHYLSTLPLITGLTDTATSHGCLWYSLKSPEILPSTVLWQANHGRHRAP